jgi:fatty acid desaturase
MVPVLSGIFVALFVVIVLVIVAVVVFVVAIFVIIVVFIVSIVFLIISIVIFRHHLHSFLNNDVYYNPNWKNNSDSMIAGWKVATSTE